MRIFRGISKGQLIPLVFMQDAVAASQTAVALKIVDAAGATETPSNDVTGIAIPWPFRIVGISANLSAAGSAGALTVDATIGGTVTGLQAAITTETTKTTVQDREADKGAAGAIVGAKLTTNGTWNGTTADLAVTVWVLIDLDGI